MTYWLPNNQKLFLPPTPIAKPQSTDAYVTRTDMFYLGHSERLLTVGHPYWEIKQDQTVTVPKVSPNQFRVFRVRLPNPNKFAFPEKSVFNVESERLVWAVRGVEILRGQPLGVPVSGHPLFNRLADVENPNKGGEVTQDNRQNVAFDVKQVQYFCVGCRPALGEHWTKSKTCVGVPDRVGSCPPIEMITSSIEDGDMIDLGFGAMDNYNLQANRSDSPLDTVLAVTKYPDFIKMSNDTYGDSSFFYSRREQVFSRHFFSRGGSVGEELPATLYLKPKQAPPRVGTSVYTSTPSGSLVTSDAQLFNRPYWLQRALGLNNGVCWNDQLFVTVADNTRGTHMTISVSKTGKPPDNYQADQFNVFLRHVEEYELGFIFQLCKVSLTAETLAHIHNMDPSILERWELGVAAPQAQSVEDTYRYIQSLATKCPDNVAPKPPEDPYDKLRWWDVDLTERLSTDLEQFPLGRKFLLQSNLQPVTRKRKPAPSKPRTAKRRRGA
ncbi:L1 [Equus caballus papillomavirus 8]|uniref:Major capsid protein L1 n=2 Tax=Equus caballus papillomavirus 8 TaxID=1912759 RepID=A0A1D9EPX3_9PAPI|nr:L1 [Equus caballus papillomavirus 8]AOY65119.1 L1 [Equus caballus papillomavirus 8]